MTPEAPLQQIEPWTTGCFRTDMRSAQSWMVFSHEEKDGDAMNMVSLRSVVVHHLQMWLYIDLSSDGLWILGVVTQCLDKGLGSYDNQLGLCHRNNLDISQQSDVLVCSAVSYFFSNFFLKMFWADGIVLRYGLWEMEKTNH